MALSLLRWATWLASVDAVLAVPYEEYILAPTSRTIYPQSVYKNLINGTVTGADTITGNSPGSAIFEGPSSLTYDFSKNIGGLVSLKIGNVDADQYIGIAYSESSEWISNEGCDATQNAGIDEILWFQPTEPGTVSVDRIHERGGFRYLTVLHNTTGSLELQQIEVYFTAMPHVAEDELRNYTGYFHTDDELLNRIWYAGAYTNQMITIDPTHGNSLVHLSQNYTGNAGVPDQTWYLNYTILNGSSALVDGAKRDRLVWPGDLAIGIPSIFASTNDLETIAVSLDSLFAEQNTTTGMLPYAGTPPFTTTYSPTYHLYNLIDVAYYYLYT